jgi:hypothetical protein
MRLGKAAKRDAFDPSLAVGDADRCQYNGTIATIRRILRFLFVRSLTVARDTVVSRIAARFETPEPAE